MSVKPTLCSAHDRAREDEVGGGVGRGGEAELGVRDNSDDGQPPLARTVMPKDTVSAGRAVLSVTFENLFPASPFQTPEFVGVKRRMLQIGFHKTESFSHCLQNCFLRRIFFQFSQLKFGLLGETEFKNQGYSLAYLAKDPSFFALPARD